MIFGPLDSAIEQLGRVWARATGWRPEAQSVRLTITEGPPGIYQSTRTARIERVHDSTIIVTLDAEWPEIAADGCTRLQLTPRFAGHGVWRLPVARSYVNVFCERSGESPQHGPMLTICEMRLER